MNGEAPFDRENPGQESLGEFAEHQRLEVELMALNESLEERVAERTAELERRTEQLRLLALEDAKFAPGQGTYRVANNSLVLLYADGRKIRANFHLGDQVARDDVTFFLISTRRFVKIR